MFGFFRKHRWILVVALSLTIISFLFWGANTLQMGGGGGGGGTKFGTVYGQKITQDDYLGAKREFYLFYLFHYRAWPDKAGMTEMDLNREIYIRLLLVKKAGQLGIHVSDEAAGKVANQLLRSLGRNGEAVTMESFESQVLKPETVNGQSLSVVDFENFAKHDITIQELVQTLGLSGALVTPQEASEIYSRENQERATQIIFFSASNYLADVKTTPEAATQFYTNYLAEYRLPERVQVGYVAFEASNFLAQSKAELAKTNLEDEVNAIYLNEGLKDFPDAKTPDEAKQKIRDILIFNHALKDAGTQANDFATAVFDMNPVKAENLGVVATKMGLRVKVAAPFDSQSAPPGISAPEDFAKAAFGLTADEPFAGPIVGTNAIYVIALDKRLPSEIPHFADIKDRVTQDFQMQQAIALARQAGTNAAIKLMVNIASGKDFNLVCVADALLPQKLPPFSLNTRELPELGTHAGLNQIKQTAFTTAIGHASNFQETGDGGFILYVQSQLPVDTAAMNANLPEFTAELRRSRENEAFQEWLNVEANRELTDTLFAREAAAKQQP